MPQPALQVHFIKEKRTPLRQTHSQAPLRQPPHQKFLLLQSQTNRPPPRKHIAPTDRGLEHPRELEGRSPRSRFERLRPPPSRHLRHLRHLLQCPQPPLLNRIPRRSFLRPAPVAASARGTLPHITGGATRPQRHSARQPRCCAASPPAPHGELQASQRAARFHGSMPADPTTDNHASIRLPGGGWGRYT